MVGQDLPVYTGAGVDPTGETLEPGREWLLNLEALVVDNATVVLQAPP